MDLKVKQMLEILDIVDKCCPIQFGIQSEHKCKFNNDCFECWYSTLFHEKDKEKYILEELENEN